ncbi:MAG: LysR family transcriptional regulator [Pseudomonadota bacterium]
MASRSSYGQGSHWQLDSRQLQDESQSRNLALFVKSIHDVTSRSPLLDLRHYQMIAMLAKIPRVTDAAEQLGITPSALSHRIREAERRLGVPLFTRSHKRLRMTATAKYLAQVAERIIADLIRAEHDAERMGYGVRHVIRLAVEAYSSYHWLPQFLRHLKEHSPDIGIQVIAAAARNPIERLADHTVDLVIVSGEIGQRRLEAIHLFDDELKFIMPPDHRLAGKAFIEGQDVVGESFITYTRIPEPDREYARLFRPNDTYPNWTETVELPEAIVEMVAAGLGTSVLAGWAVKGAIDGNRIVGARVGREGVSVPWHVVVRPAETPEDEIGLHVADTLASWCNETDGFRR